MNKYSITNCPTNKKLSALLTRPDIWQGSTSPQRNHGLPTGYPALDKALHQGGWPVGAITELLCDHSGIGELQLLLPTLAQYARQKRNLIFVSPPYIPYAPALQDAGISPAQIVIVQTRSTIEQLWAVGQLLQSGAAGAVLTWLTHGPVNHHQLRKLQLAAQESHSLAVLFRPGITAAEASPAALRITVSPGQRGYQLHIIKQRGGWAGQIVDITRPDGLIQQHIRTADLPVHQPLQNQSDNPWPLTRPLLDTPSSVVENTLH